MYKIVHTGANNQLGGLNQGLFKVLNQSLTEEAVNKPETAPTARGIRMEIINLVIDFIKVVL